jgi:Carboxypeptidase regulatory-like domain/TonB-dependent Receptor Plug Domain
MNKGRWKLKAAGLVLVLVGIIAFPTLVRAQASATINGTVTDASGAVIPHAAVTAVNLATSGSRTAETNDTGTYSIASLVPGSYDVTIEKSGFKTTKFAGVVLTVDQSLTLDLKLEVSGTSQTVTVEAGQIAAINTSDAQISTVVEQKQIQDLPLILRDPYQLVLLTPGATQTNTGLGGFSINGAREQNNNFLLDGTNNNDPGVPGAGFALLNPDDTEELRVITNNYLPEFGRNSGSIIDIITRSGSNELHGDVYYFGRWDALGARDPFNPASQGPVNPYVRNIFGASIGGPIEKNKLFYFFNYEGQRFSTTTQAQATVPAAGFSTGKFTYVDPVSGPVNVDVSTPGCREQRLQSRA